MEVVIERRLPEKTPPVAVVAQYRFINIRSSRAEVLPADDSVVGAATTQTITRAAVVISKLKHKWDIIQRSTVDGHVLHAENVVAFIFNNFLIGINIWGFVNPKPSLARFLANLGVRGFSFLDLILKFLGYSKYSLFNQVAKAILRCAYATKYWYRYYNYNYYN